MSTKRKSTSSGVNYNFRPQNEFQKRGETKGTKPLPDPASVGKILLTMLIHGCRKILFVNTYIKIGAYLGIFFISYIFDFSPLPRSYFSQSSNVFNQYFVKLGWAWTLVLCVPFTLLTSFTYCCGNRKMVGLHLLRLTIATVVWFVFTNSFVIIENNTGKCSVKSDKFVTKHACVTAGHFWHSFDISGHAFILVYSCLVIIEEAKAIIGWETIEDFIRNEEYNRSANEKDLGSPLKNLSDEEFFVLRVSFKKFAPYVRGLFVAMTLLTVLWDVMILSTALYFHTMIEKLMSGIMAGAVWFITYQIWFSNAKTIPYGVGQGSFLYNKRKSFNGSLPRAPSTSSSKTQTFMGMPLFTNNGSSEPFDEEDLKAVNKITSLGRASVSQNSRLGPVTRSQSYSRADL